MEDLKAYGKDNLIKDLGALYKTQKEYFNKGETRSYAFRKAQLIKLKSALKSRESQFIEALEQDFRKPPIESYITEVGFIYEEINFALKHLKSWMKPKRIKTPLILFPSFSKVLFEPKGVCLIVAPWNYPLHLSISPLIAAISAGNTAIVKLPEETPVVSDLIYEMIASSFSAEYVTSILGEGIKIVPALMENFRFDHVFFTGSAGVGKIIAKMAAEKLTPITLELGGKSPVIVDKTANIRIAAKRIVFGKWVNAGQTCVAPDYAIIHKDIKEDFLSELKKCIHQFYGKNPLENSDLASIINAKRFKVLSSFLEEGNILIGGETKEETLRISPTVIDGVSMHHKVMKEEIFGPILPVLEYENEQEVLDVVAQNSHPLSLYIFTQNKKIENFFLQNIAFGGGAVNDAIIHPANPNLPFGGIGSSGIGAYHGKYGFDTFSHQKAIVKSVNWFDLKSKYPPYTVGAMKLVKRLMR